MSEYIYRTDFERNRTRQYEGTYTPEEVELNCKLMEACCEEQIDFALVEDLLTQGADPLGATKTHGWCLLDHVYGEIIRIGVETDNANLPQITELFLKYGMNVDKPRIPYNADSSFNPLWFLTFAQNENALAAMKMLLDYGVSANSFAKFFSHTLKNFFHLDRGDPEHDEVYGNKCAWAFRMILLGCSYDHILENNEFLQNFICLALNSYDLKNFRNWNRYDYQFDTSRNPSNPMLCGSVLRIYDKVTGEEVWKIGVGSPRILTDG